MGPTSLTTPSPSAWRSSSSSPSPGSSLSSLSSAYLSSTVALRAEAIVRRSLTLATTRQRETASTTRSWTTDTPSPNSPFLIWTRPCPRRQREDVVGSDWLTCLAITTRDQTHLYQKDRFSCPHSKNEELPLKQPSLRVTVIFLLRSRNPLLKNF